MSLIKRMIKQGIKSLKKRIIRRNESVRLYSLKQQKLIKKDKERIRILRERLE